MKLKINEGFNKDLWVIRNTNEGSGKPPICIYDYSDGTGKVATMRYENRGTKFNHPIGSETSSRLKYACLFTSEKDANRFLDNYLKTKGNGGDFYALNVYNSKLFTSDIEETVPIKTDCGWCLISTENPVYKQNKEQIDKDAIRHLRQNYSKFNDLEDEDLDVKSKIKKAASDYKGSSRKGEPTDITSYRDDELSFEFEGISSMYDVSIANAFVNKYLAKYKLAPEQIDILDFTDEDDRKIGKAIICRFD